MKFFHTQGYLPDIKSQLIHLIDEFFPFLLKRAFLIAQPSFLLEYVTLDTVPFQCFSLFFLLGGLCSQFLDGLSGLGQLVQGLLPSGFLLADVGFEFLLFSPLGQKEMDLPSFHRLLHLPVQPCNLLQGRQFFFLLFSQLLMAFIVADILLHSHDIRFFRDIADIFGDKLLNICDRFEGDSLLHHPHDLFVMDIPFGQQIIPVFFLDIVQFTPCAIFLFDIGAEHMDIHSRTFSNKAVFRNHAVIEKESFLPVAVVITIKDDTRDKLLFFDVIPELTGNIAGEILSPPGMRIVFIHVSPQITVQRPLRFFVGSLVKIAGIGLSQQYDLQSVDDG